MTKTLTVPRCSERPWVPILCWGEYTHTHGVPGIVAIPATAMTSHPNHSQTSHLPRNPPRPRRKVVQCKKSTALIACCFYALNHKQHYIWLKWKVRVVCPDGIEYKLLSVRYRCLELMSRMLSNLSTLSLAVTHIRFANGAIIIVIGVHVWVQVLRKRGSYGYTSDKTW